MFKYIILVFLINYCDNFSIPGVSLKVDYFYNLKDLQLRIKSIPIRY